MARTPGLRNRILSTLYLFSAVSLLVITADSYSAEPGQSGIMYVGGQVRNGTKLSQHTGQALVHYFLPKLSNQETNGVPVIMYPGLGLTSYIYISTPDNREGWAMDFVRQGHPVYVIDPVFTGPSGLAVESTTQLTSWDIDFIWPRWGFGEERDKPYDNVRFPIDHIDQFYASLAVRPSPPASRSGPPPGLQGGSSPTPASEALTDLLLKIDEPTVLLTHSAGYAATDIVTRLNPELVAATIVIETTGCPTAESLGSYSGKPFLALYGDYIDSRGQTTRYNRCKSAVEMLNSNNGDATFLDMPEIGIQGNTHILMQDNNSDSIAKMLTDWLAEKF